MNPDSGGKEMERTLSPGPTSPASLERSVSQHSAASTRSYRSGTVRPRKRITSQRSSSTSSVAASEDKSLTSFPSFSGDSPHDDRPLGLPSDFEQPQQQSQQSKQSQQQQQQPPPARPDSIVESLTDSTIARSALFEDAPAVIATRKIPGALHLADDVHIARLVARHGAVALVRQMAEDLARRDAQMASLRRRADERERALRKIALECGGLSSLDLERRLRAVEREARAASGTGANAGRAVHHTGGGGSEGLSDLMTDAMEDYGGFVTRSYYGSGGGGGVGADADNDSLTMGRSTAAAVATVGKNGGGTLRAWREYLWGSSTVKKDSRSSGSSVNSDGARISQTVIRAAPGGDRRPALQQDLFSPPPPDISRSSSRASSIQSGEQNLRKASLASLALRLVAGGGSVPGARDDEARGRANSAQATPGGGSGASTGAGPNGGGGGSLRASSLSSVKTSNSTRAASMHGGGPKALMAMRRTAGVQGAPVGVPSRARPPERWDTMKASPENERVPRQESYGPVEMDTILPPEAQPPTLTHIYNNYNGSEYLTDRFGFIYDQRRKKRQREAAQIARHMKKGSRHEMLTNGRSGGLSPVLLEDSTDAKSDSDIAAIGVGVSGASGDDGRPGTPSSTEEGPDGAKPKRWQDYLKIATFPTELLSHTPSISVPGFEVTEGTGDLPKSPGASSTATAAAMITAQERGFVPPASSATSAVDSETQAGSASEPEQQQTAGTLVKEDVEPVKLLLQQLSEVHDMLQREKTVRWNDFLRKVRAERRREGEAAAAAAAAAAGGGGTATSGSSSSSATGLQKTTTVVMPEARLGDGELIGVASLGLQGKVGRAKANEFKSLILGGIPVAYRAKIWSECSGAKALRMPGYYDDLVKRPESGQQQQQQQHQEDDAQVVLQIRADITRTLTDNIFFRKGPGVGKLNEVLLAYARRNPEVGYCQGMNLVAANLLLIMPTAEDAFWVLVSIVEHILPPGYFDHSLLASRADQQVLRGYVAEVLPRLSGHFDALAIDLETMTFQWFLSVFTDCLSAEALFRVWDVVLCNPHDRGAFLFQVALALLKLNEPQLLACDSPAAVYTYINHQMTNHAISIDGLVQASEALRRVVRRDDVEARRAAAVAAEREVVRLREERNAARRKVGGGGGGGGDSNTIASTAETKPVVPTVIVAASEEGLVDDDDVAGLAESLGELTEQAPIPMSDDE